MKKFLLGMISVFAIVLCLVACGEAEVTLKDVSIEGQKVEFFVGDEFSYGGLKVTATYSDETTKDVTNEAKKDQNSNMNAAGTYAVLVSYENITKAYQISVIDNKEIQSIKADASSAKVNYYVGEKIDYANVLVIEAYKNAANVESINYGELSKYSVKVTDAEGNEVSDTFEKAGTYKVTISKDELVASYNVEVAYKAYASLEEAVEALNENADKVLSGELSYKQDNFEESSYTYLFGKNHLEVSNGYSTSYYQVLEDGEALGITDIDGNISKDYSATEDNVKGVNISSFFYHLRDVYGAEGLVNELYGLHTTEGKVCLNYVENAKACDNCGYIHTYEFNFDTILSEYIYVNVDVEFTLNPATGSLENLDIAFKGYLLENMVQDEETGLYSVKNGVTDLDVDTSISAVQVAGERTKENPYNIENLLYSSFDLVDSEGNVIGEEVDAEIANQLVLTIANAQPETANTNIDSIVVSCTTLEGEEFPSAYGYYSESENAIIITSYKAKDIKVTVKTTNCEKTFVMKVANAQLTSLTAGLDEWGNLVEADTAKVAAGVELQFGAIANDGADASFTASLQEESDKVTLEAAGEYYTFVASEVGTYVVVLTSTVNSEITATLTITVVERANMAELLNGEYIYNDYFSTIEYTFTPESEGAVKGDLTIDDGENVGEFTYEWDGTELVVTAKEGTGYFMYGVVFMESTQSLWAASYGFEIAELERVTADVEGTLSGSYKGSDTYYGQNRIYTIKFNSDGTGEFEFQTYYYTGTFEWELDEENNIIFSNIEESYGADSTFTATYNEEENTISLSYEFTIIDEYSGEEYSDTGSIDFNK